MKLIHVIASSELWYAKKVYFATVEGSHHELLSLIAKLYDANELLDIKLFRYMIDPAIAADEGLMVV